MGRIDCAVALAKQPGLTVASFGDMLRVPGSTESLHEARAAGGSVAVVYSPLDAVRLDQRQPDRQIIFFAVGFETTAPATALAVSQAAHLGLRNFTMLVAHVLVTPAMTAIAADPTSGVQGFLGAGHASTITGTAEYKALAEQYRLPIVVTGFEPVDLLDGLARLVELLEAGRVIVDNSYRRVVREEGNAAARSRIDEVYEVCDQHWRGLGRIPRSGLRLRNAYREFDADWRFGYEEQAESPSECRAGEVLQGRLRPCDCLAYGRTCTPERPLGAPMVSTEGACAAYWHAGRAPTISLPLL